MNVGDEIPTRTSQVPERTSCIVAGAVLITMFAGLFAAGVLSLGHGLHLPIPCGRSQGCAAVAQHPSSQWLGIPVAYFGVAAYLALIALIQCAGTGRWVPRLFFLVAGSGAGISAALLYHSQTVIQATCHWCVASGAAMTLLALFGAWWLRAGSGLQPCHVGWFWTLALVTSTGLGAQAGAMQRSASRPPVPPRALAEMTDVDWAIPSRSLGPVDAPVTIVVFADASCPACRTAYGALSDFQARHANAVRIGYRHLPLWELPGHRFSGTAAALGEIAAESGKFWEFMDRVHHESAPLDSAGHVRVMSDLGLDTEDLEGRLSDPDDSAIQAVQRDMALAERLGIESTPTFLVLVEGQHPVSATMHTLPKLLSAPAVTVHLQSHSTPPTPSSPSP